MSEPRDGCVKPARGPILAAPDTTIPGQDNSIFKEAKKMLALLARRLLIFRLMLLSKTMVSNL